MGEQARGVKILTFHSFALKLLAQKVQHNSQLDSVISQATKALQNNQISLPYTEMLMLDEYQDINKQSYEFIKAIFSQMSGEKQIIAVGDDDQLIMEFNGANQKFMQDFASDFGQVEDLAQDSNTQDKQAFSKHTLSTNYRSGGKIIDFINAFRQAFLHSSLKKQNLAPSYNNQHKGFVSFTHHKHNLSLQAIAKQIKEILATHDCSSDSKIALLLRNNDEVLSAQYELENLGIKTACLLERDKFEAGDLIELWEFLELLKKGIDKEIAQAKICQKYAKSSNLVYFNRALEVFEREYEEDLAFIKTQKSTDGTRLKDFGNKLLAKDFETFLSELKFEEIKQTKAKVIIATMHKAKGKEFDIVFVGIKRDFAFSDSSEKRLLYVAFSRAKKQLHIHAQGEELHRLCAHFNKYNICEAQESSPSKIRYEMGLDDIFLSYEKAQHNLKHLELVAGDKVEIRQDLQDLQERIELFYRSKCVGRLSKAFTNTLLDKIASGYTLQSSAMIKYVVQWRNKERETMTTQVLCEIILSRN